MLVQIPLKMSLRDDASFETFVAEQESLALVISQLQQSELSTLSHCYYFFGEAGVGKTHVLQAACRFYTERKKQSVYFPMANVGLPLIPDVLRGLEVTELVCLDDVDKVIGDEQWEVALASFIAKSRVQGHRVLLSGHKAMTQWQVVTDILAAELMQILPVELKPVQGHRELVLILQRHARYMGFDLPLEVGNFLIKRFSTDLQELLTVLKLLEQATLAEKRRLTLPFVKQVLMR